MSADHAAEWVYRGVWGALTGWLRVPDAPPTLPVKPGETLRSFRPSAGWLRMRKMQFWIAVTIIDLGLLAVWLVVLYNDPKVAAWMALPWLFIMIVPDVIAYIAVYLRYDTTWYVLSERSVRIRRRIWTIEEKTFTFENVQNIAIRQGPVQRWFGVADLVIQTAGGGSVATPHGAGGGGGHHGQIEGVDNAEEIRDLIMTKVRAARDAGLGDDDDATEKQEMGFSEAHLHALREIRDLARTLSGRP